MKNIKLPKGIGARIINKDGTFTDVPDPYLESNKYPNISIDSTKFKKEKSSTRLYMLALEFLNTSKLLCHDAGKLKNELRWTQGSLTFYCLHMATELFLKSCLKRTDNKIKLNHNVADLYKQYCTTFEGKGYEFPTPWGISNQDINEMVGEDVIKGIDAKPDQAYRYFEDKNGDPPQSIHFFSPGYQLNYVNDLEKRWIKIADELKNDNI